MNALLRFLLRLLFRFSAHHTEVLNGKGPMLLIPNHVSWLDWLYVGCVLDDDWRFVSSSKTAETSWLHRKIMVNRRTFPIDQSSPYAVRTMSEYLEKGGKLVLFAEGRISTTGSLMKLFEGTAFLIQRSKARVVTCYLRGAVRQSFSKHSGWKRWFPRVSVHFSPVLTQPDLSALPHSQQRSHLTAWLRDAMLSQQFEVEMKEGPKSVPGAVAEMAAAQPSRIALEDVAGAHLSGRRMLVGASLLSARMQVCMNDSDRVAVLLPNVAATPLVLLGLWKLGRVPAILNFSSGIPTMLECCKLAGTRQLITSRVFLEKAKLNAEPFAAAGIRVLFLEDLRAMISGPARLGALLRSYKPGALKSWETPECAQDTAVVLFTSGSEGTPKGVELTHHNLLANIRQAIAVIDLTDADRFFNALPIFHSFGLTAGTLLPLIRGCGLYLYPTPLHYRTIPVLVYDQNCTVLLGTNTFLNGYARKAHAYDFNSLRYLIAGAEKVQDATVDTYARRFGIRILEGYGATECSPVISVNTRMDPKLGSAGRFLPGIEHRLEPVEGVTTGGRLFVRGPNVMKGYLNEDANARFLALNGWYDTGDIVSVDTEGFLHIHGRMKRFAKVSGEMVSLTAVEEAFAVAFRSYGPRCEVAVVTLPDADKGERLVAVTNESKLTLADLRNAIKSSGLSNLCAPRELLTLPKIPKLGSGKTNHRELTAWVQEQKQPQA
jgi:acyl-[acyl-carrier-protein]-phospholipid O-acyltransferase/long-chain-fatty-acid--[acyl-carrier-protein] ligase